MGAHHSIAEKAAPQHGRAWTTEAELEFIAGLGTHSIIGEHLGRAEMLLAYRSAISRRWNWDGMHQHRVLQELGG